MGTAATAADNKKNASLTVPRKIIGQVNTLNRGVASLHQAISERVIVGAQQVNIINAIVRAPAWYCGKNDVITHVTQATSDAVV